MRILFASSEMVPYIKTGGLADVSGALPRALAELGHEVTVVLPLYQDIDRDAFPMQPVPGEVRVRLTCGEYTFRIWQDSQSGANGTRVKILFYEEDPLFGRPRLYDSPDGVAYPDNPIRFGCWCLAVLKSLQKMGWRPDILHCNDWQTAMIPVYLHFHPTLNNDPFFQSTGILYSIHNMAYQGLCPLLQTTTSLDLPDYCRSPGSMEFHGQLNLMKGGLLYSNRLVTVSRRYSEEIRTPEFGCGLEGVMQDRSDALSGILNGIDTETWNPADDPLIAANYDPGQLDGKAACKKSLKKIFGINKTDTGPVMAMISRLTEQKGLDLLLDVIPRFLDQGCPFVVLGSGDDRYQKRFMQLVENYPGLAGVRLDFDEQLAHEIEAGADIYLMPSQYEPCGLNQLYSLRYGTVPVVRRTGGLADSVSHASPENLDGANGFVFDDYSAEAFADALQMAVEIYCNEQETWTRLMQNGMNGDYSWEKSALKYERVMTGILESGF